MGCVSLSCQGVATVTPEEFFGVSWPEAQPVVYRLYHDDQGLPLFYSMDLVPGTYIEITQQQYAASSMWVRVVDGVLVDRPWQITSKLVPSTCGTACHPHDVTIVADKGTFWSNQTYDPS